MLSGKKGLFEIYLDAISKYENAIEKIEKALSAEDLDINEQDDIGNTLLHNFVILLHRYFGDYAHFRLNHFFEDMDNFMALGANPALRNADGQTVIDLFFSKEIRINNFDKITFVPEFIELYKKYSQYTPEIISIFKNCEKLDPKLSFVSQVSGAIHVEGLPYDCLETILKWVDDKFKEKADINHFRDKLLAEMQWLENHGQGNPRKFMQERYAQYQKQDKLNRQGLFAELLQRQKQFEESVKINDQSSNKPKI